MKEILVKSISVNPNTASTIYASPDEVLVNNTGTVPIRIDKEMLQITAYHNGTTPMILGLVVHVSDKSGNSMSADIVSGTTTLPGLNTLLNKWRDNVFMTDFQWVGTGSDENLIFQSELAADTRRILQPQQKLLLTVLVMPVTTEAKTMNNVIDNIVWYSPASQ